MSLPKIGHRKIILLAIFLFFLSLSLSFVQTAQAAYRPRPAPATNPMAPLDQYREALEAEELNYEQFTRYTVDFMSEAGTQALVGVPPLEGQSTGGALGGAITLIAGLYNTPPASSIDYLADIGQNLGLAKPAYAQGAGWHALYPIIDLWRMCRNVAYLFLVVVFVVVGFMIMFRAKIDPQTVASIQNALPQLIIALILITFSYALAGLMFDFIAFGIAIINNLIDTGGIATPPINLNLFQLLEDAFGGIDINIVNVNIPPVGLMAIINLVQGIISIIPGAGSSIFVFILAVVVVFTMFKLFFALLSRYVTFLLATIFGPLLLLLSAIPGRGNFVFMWLKTLIKAALVFPAVYAMLAIGAIISNAPSWGTTVSMDNLQAPRMLAEIFTDPKLIKNIIGLGILLVTPSIPDMIDQAFERRPGPPAFAAAAQTIRGVIGRMPIVGGLASGI